MPTCLVELVLPEDRAAAIAFLVAHPWPFHGVPNPTAADLAGAAFGAPDALSFWVVVGAQRVGLVRALDLQDIGRGSPVLDLRIAPEHRGLGHGAAALRLLTEEVFQRFAQAHRIEGATRADNAAMARTFESVGYRREGRLRQAWPSADGWQDTLIFGILRGDPRR